MTPVLLTVMQDHPGFLIHGPDGGVKVKPFEESDDALEFLAWCTENACAASPLFSLAIHYQGGRVWMITPEDGDAAFALKMRWL